MVIVDMTVVRLWPTEVFLVLLSMDDSCIICIELFENIKLRNVDDFLIVNTFF